MIFVACRSSGDDADDLWIGWSLILDFSMIHTSLVCCLSRIDFVYPPTAPLSSAPFGLRSLFPSEFCSNLSRVRCVFCCSFSVRAGLDLLCRGTGLAAVARDVSRMPAVERDLRPLHLSLSAAAGGE